MDCTEACSSVSNYAAGLETDVVCTALSCKCGHTSLSSFQGRPWSCFLLDFSPWQDGRFVACQHAAVMTSSVCCAAGGDQTLIFHVCRFNTFLFYNQLYFLYHFIEQHTNNTRFYCYSTISLISTAICNSVCFLIFFVLTNGCLETTCY